MPLEPLSLARTLRRTITAGAVAVTALVPATSTAGAVEHDPASGPQGYEHDILDYLLLFDDQGEGIVVTVGARIEQICIGDVATAPLRVFTDRDGAATLKVRGEQDAPLFVYEFAGPAPALIDAGCGALFDGDPATQPPEPWAEGSGLLKVTVSGIEAPDDPGGYFVANSINGRATAIDGSQWKVKGSTSFELDEGGTPIGDPTDFQDASIHRIGPRS